jgi:hypothetical protein
MASVKVDSKGRISLGKFAHREASAYQIDLRDDGTLLLTPVVEVPANEAWLFKNARAAASVRRGLDQSSKGKKKNLGSFAKYVEHDE